MSSSRLFCIKKSPFVKELICAIKDPAYTCNEHQVRSISTNELIPVDLDSRDEFIDYHQKYLNEHDIDLLGDEESDND